jgi:DNA-binding NarL/FixJ family response regulator
MIRLGLYSDDRELQPILSSALGREFEVLVAFDEASMNRMLTSNGCDVVVIDLDSNHSCLQKRIEFARRIAASDVSTVLMVDDALRATAVELVRLGAHGYCR